MFRAPVKGALLTTENASPTLSIQPAVALSIKFPLPESIKSWRGNTTITVNNNYCDLALPGVRVYLATCQATHKPHIVVAFFKAFFPALRTFACKLPPFSNVMASIIVGPDLIRNEKIRILKILLLEQLTPLLRKEIHHAITLHKHSNDEDVDTLFNRIVEHWTKIYGNLIARAHLIEDIALFQKFLTLKLLEDYAKKPCTVTEWVFNKADIIEQHHAKAKGGNDEDTTYQIGVVFPLDELMLNRDHVEKKLLSTVSEPRSGSHIQRLVDRKDWSSLATTLANDRDLAVGLFREQPFDPNLFDENTRKKVLRGIDEMERKYLKSHRSIGTHATEETVPRNSFAWDVYNAIASGLRGASPSLRSGSVTKDL